MGNNKKHKPCIFCHFWIPQNGREHPQDSHLQNISRERQTSPISGLDFEYISVFPFPTIFPKFQDLNLVFSHFSNFSHFSHGTFSMFEDPSPTATGGCRAVVCSPPSSEPVPKKGPAGAAPSTESTWSCRAVEGALGSPGEWRGLWPKCSTLNFNVPSGNLT